MGTGTQVLKYIGMFLLELISSCLSQLCWINDNKMLNCIIRRLSLCYYIQDKTIQTSLGDFPPVQRLKILVKIDENLSWVRASIE